MHVAMARSFRRQTAHVNPPLVINPTELTVSGRTTQEKTLLKGTSIRTVQIYDRPCEGTGDD